MAGYPARARPEWPPPGPIRLAAATRIELPLDQLFHSDGYRGHSQGLALAYSLGVYHGAAGLAAFGLTAVGEQARRLGVRPYPHMLRWLRE